MSGAPQSASSSIAYLAPCGLEMIAASALKRKRSAYTKSHRSSFTSVFSANWSVGIRSVVTPCFSLIVRSRTLAPNKLTWRDHEPSSKRLSTTRRTGTVACASLDEDQPAKQAACPERKHAYLITRGMHRPQRAELDGWDTVGHKIAPRTEPNILGTLRGGRFIGRNSMRRDRGGCRAVEPHGSKELNAILQTQAYACRASTSCTPKRADVVEWGWGVVSPDRSGSHLCLFFWGSLIPPPPPVCPL